MVCMCQPGHCAVMHGRSHAIIRFVVSQAPLIILQAVWLWYKALHARDLHSTAHTSYLGLGCVRVQLWPAVGAIGRVQRAIGIHGPKEKATGELICTSTMLDLTMQTQQAQTCSGHPFVSLYWDWCRLRKEGSCGNHHSLAVHSGSYGGQ